MRDFGFLSLLVLRHAAATSFYDNPEQDVLYNQQPVDDDTGVNWPQEELQKRWGNDVRSLSSLNCQNFLFEKLFQRPFSA